MLFLYSLYNILFAILAKKVYKAWFNPISLYVVVWELAVGLHESGLFVFYELSRYTWFIIFLLQSIFFVSCILGAKTVQHFNPTYTTQINQIDDKCLQKQLKKYIILTTLIAAIGILINLYGTISKYGINLLDNITTIYANRVYDDEMVSTIPYIGSFLFIALPLVGIYLKKFGFNLFLLPVFILPFLSALNSGGRSGIVFSMFLFASAYFITMPNIHKIKKPKNKKKKFFMILGVSVFIVMFTLISIRRNAGQILAYATPTFNSIFGKNLFVYKILMYICTPIGVLNEYLITSDFHFGQNTFLTIFNLLNRLGIGSKINQLQEVFYTPAASNVGTWLRELIEDFTLPGAMIGVAVFGYIISWFYMCAKKDDTTKAKVIWAILSWVLSFSFFDWRLRGSGIWIALLFGYLFCSIIDKNSRQRRI